MPKKLYKRILKSGSVTMMTTIIGGLLQYVSLIIVARTLGAEQLGFYVMGFSVFTFSTLVSQWGMDVAATKYVSAYRAEGKSNQLRMLIKKFAISSTLLGLIAGLAIYLFASIYDGKTISNGVRESIRFFALGVPLSTLLMISAAVLRGLGKISEQAIVVNLIMPVARAIFIIYAALFNPTLDAMIQSNNAALLVSVALILVILMRTTAKLPNDNIEGKYSEIFKYSTKVFIAGLSGFSLNWSDVIIIGLTLDAVSVGAYRVCSQLAYLFTIISFGFAASFAPIISDLYTRDDISGINELMKKVSLAVLGLSIPLGLLFLIEPRGILDIFGPGYQQSWCALVILTLGQLFINGLGEVGWPLAICKRENEWVKYNLFVAVFNVLVLWLLIGEYGIVGAATGTMISNIILRLLGSIDLYKSLGLLQVDVSHLKCVLAALTSLAVGLLLNESSILNGLVKAIIVSLSSILIYLALIFYFFKKTLLNG